LKVEEGVKISVIYASFLAALTLYFGSYEILRFFVSSVPYLFIITLSALYPIMPLHKKLNSLEISLFVLAFLGALAIALSDIYIPADIMGGFVLILSSSLIFTGLRDTWKTLYSGLSFYIVGLFLLLSDAAIVVTIILADVSDYYINCIGESCSPYNFILRPEVILLFLGIFALYPFFKRSNFKRKEYDQETA